MPAAQINLPAGLPRAAVRQALANVSAALAAIGSSAEHVSVWVNEVEPELWSAPGPFVHVTVLSVRPVEVLQHLVRQVTEGLAHALGGLHDQVQVVVSTAPPELWAIGGVPASVVRAEGLAARIRTAD